MNPYRSRIRPALAALAVLLLGATVAVADEHRFQSEATLVLVDSHGNHYTREGSGQATGLGQFMVVSYYKAEGHGFEGIATLAGANGDSLMLVWTNAPVGDHYEGTYQIIGGTGRFANATGAGTMRVDVEPDGTTTDQVFDGTIAF